MPLQDFSCIQCNIKFQEYNCNRKQKNIFCSFDCYKKWKKGKSNNSFTKFKKGNHPQSEFKKGHIAWNKGKKTGILTPHKYGCKCFRCDKKIGEKHHNWKGDKCITPIKQRIKESYNWIQWRAKIFQRDAFICRICCREGYIVHPHHMHPFEFSKILHYLKDRFGIKNLYESAINYEPLWSLEIGVTLCEECHRKTNNYGVNTNGINKILL